MCFMRNNSDLTPNINLGTEGSKAKAKKATKSSFNLHLVFAIVVGKKWSWVQMRERLKTGLSLGIA